MSNTYKENVALLLKYNDEYYNKDNSSVTDAEYDKLFNEVKAEEKRTGVIADNSPTQKVGIPVKGKLPKLNHITAMWSLDNAYSIDDLKSWFNKQGTDVTLHCTPKYDGSSLNLVYEDGKLVHAITRGDGTTGEDITKNALEIDSIPKTIQYKDTLEVRGEVVIYKDDFEAINKERKKKGLKLNSNPRNSASGGLRLLDSSKIAERRLTFIPYGLGKNSFDNKTVTADMETLDKLGFIKPPVVINNVTISGLSDLIKIDKNPMANLDMETDGIVLKVDQKDLHSKIGYTAKFPKFAMAYKFPAKSYTTKLESIKLQVSRQGIITPVANVAHILIGGVIVSKATLHNFDEIMRLDIRIGDTVNITRGGEVIPKILSVVMEDRCSRSELYTPPVNCPSCNEPLTNYVCTNDKCPDQIIGRIDYFTSKHCLDINGLGIESITSLVKKGLVKEPKDVLYLTKDDISKLNGFKEAKINNLYKSIQNVKGLPYWKFINSLDIPNVGKTASKLIVKLFGKTFMDVTSAEYMNVEGFGDTIVKSLEEFISTKREHVEELVKKLEPILPDAVITDDRYNGKKVVITGTFDAPRNVMIADLESRGAKVINGVTKNTDILISSGIIGKKYETAKKLGILIIKNID